MKDFKYAILVAVVCLAASAVWGANTAMGAITALTLSATLAILEISFSFDNAVINAAKLKTIDVFWQRMFLTVGMLIAVVGMRLLFPIVIVDVATGLGFLNVAQMAISAPQEYARHLTEAHVSIATFGGMFLLMVFLVFLMDSKKETHWVAPLETRLSALGQRDWIPTLISLITLLAMYFYLPVHADERQTMLLAGICGVVLYLLVSLVEVVFEGNDTASTVIGATKASGLAGFMYLEVLDASFSFDGVIGAFAMTQDVVIIMLGLMIGAMFVRSLTVFLVRQGTLDQYIFLEHGAHYGIGALALVMLLSLHFHIPEVVTGLIGVAFIALSIVSSVRHKRLGTVATV